MRIVSGMVPHVMDITDMDFDIHRLETDAYFAVLKAFNAQSDVLSWGKEGLLSELRKELRVSDVEHRETLGKINKDEFIKSIREWRKGADVQQELPPNSMNGPGFSSISAGHAPRKKLKTAHVTMSSSPKFLPCAQPSPVAIPSSLATHEQWSSKTDIFSHRNVGQAKKSVPQNRQTPSIAQGRGSLIVSSSKKGFIYSDIDNLKSGSDTIEIRATDKLIHEIERVCGGETPDPVQVEKAKLILREHERALIQAIGKLAEISDSDDSPDQRRQQHSYEEL